VFEELSKGYGLTHGLALLRLGVERWEGIDCKHLIEGLVIGNEPDFEEVLASPIKSELIHGQALHYGWIGIETQALTIGYGY